MKKKLVYTIKLACDPAAGVSAESIVASLRDLGDAEVTNVQMRRETGGAPKPATGAAAAGRG